MGAVMAYLDFGWSKYFIGALAKDKKESERKNDDKNDKRVLNHTMNIILIVIYCSMGLSAGIVVAGFLS